MPKTGPMTIYMFALINSIKYVWHGIPPQYLRGRRVGPGPTVHPVQSVWIMTNLPVWAHVSHVMRPGVPCCGCWSLLTRNGYFLFGSTSTRETPLPSGPNTAGKGKILGHRKNRQEHFQPVPWSPSPREPGGRRHTPSIWHSSFPHFLSFLILSGYVVTVFIGPAGSLKPWMPISSDKADLPPSPGIVSFLLTHFLVRLVRFTGPPGHQGWIQESHGGPLTHQKKNRSFTEGYKVKCLMVLFVYIFS